MLCPPSSSCTFYTTHPSHRISTKKPAAWLDWSAVIAARAHAVREYEKHKEGGDEQAQRKRLFDATLLVWLTSVPPDRVKVARTLQLGGSLKPTADGGAAARPECLLRRRAVVSGVGVLG